MKARTFFVKKLQPKNFQEEEKLSSLSLLSLPDFSFCAAFLFNLKRKAAKEYVYLR